MTIMNMTASDIGEKGLVTSIFRPLINADGWQSDDCAIIELDDNTRLAATIDAGPVTPFMKHLGVGSNVDLGHYFGTMSFSDLAAAGATPRSLLAAFLVPPDTPISVVADVAAGLDEVCRDMGAAYIGGDTKEASDLRIITVAIGVLTGVRPLRRKGARVGDLLVVSGELGHTLFSYIQAARYGHEIVRPRAEVSLGQWLARSGAATCCIDMSDGPVEAATALATANRAELMLDLRSLPMVHPPAAVLENTWLELLLGTGTDFRLMYTIRPEYASEVQSRGGYVCGSVVKTEVTPVVHVEPDIGPIRRWEHFKSTAAFEALLRDTQ